MTDNWYRNFPKILAVGVALSIGAWLGKQGTKPDTRLLADSTTIISEVPKLPYIRHNALYGLYLTVTENQGLKRQINFFDWGFDGDLDRVRICQDNRIDSVLTNSNEIAIWQPLFETYRERRFGKYDPNTHPYD